jgi:Rieske Fe-S protein
LFQTKLALYTSYVVGARIPSGLLPQASYWDSDNPYYYLRIDPGRGHDYAIFGGEDHKTGQEKNTRKPYRDLAERLRKLIPEARIERRWSGQILETHDGLPYIGEVADQQFIATGYCGNGMTFATIAALMCRDQLAGKKNPWTRLFDPSRKQLSGAWDYLKENADYPYYLLRDRIVRGSEATPGEVRRGEGKIVKTTEGKRAAYRDDQGVLTLLSAVCTHLGCLVRWNQAERTWDCPCHGSRFAPTGAVLSGPAEKPLAREDHS